jgi:glycogen debranching enzyme
MEPATSRELITVIEHANFAVSDPSGDMLPGSYHGFYVSDTRFLSRFTLRLSGKRLEPLAAAGEHHGSATFYLASPAIGRTAASSIAVIRDRSIRGHLTERIRLISYALEPVRLRLSLHLAADFADIFEVRGRSRLRRQVKTELADRCLRFVYRHRGYRRVTTVELDRDFDDDDGRLSLDAELERGRPWDLHLRVGWEQTHLEAALDLASARDSDPEGVRGWMSRVPRLRTNDPRLGAAWRQARADMASLLLTAPGGSFIPAAGLPWYLAIFGRDAAIATMQTMLLGPELALGTLRQLAAFQGTKDDAFREEEPGKIPHEVRTGELAMLEHIPHQRYYGSVDATPLYVMLFVQACRWAGWLPPVGEEASPRGPMPPTLSELLPAVERAMGWIDAHGIGRDGLVWYRRRNRYGIRNQAWKDSHDSYRFADGRIADVPIAAVEVQGYVVAAKLGLADCYVALGRGEDAARLRVEAEQLRQRIDDAFWMPDHGIHAMGLERHGRQIDSVTSNPGHLLWAGALSPERATSVSDRLLERDMFSGWGIRTMSNRMGAYNPISYHNGTIWPHDNSLISAGMARYGYKAKAWRVIDALLDASASDPDHRLPELYAGFDRRATPTLVGYPVACAPQAWATGAVVMSVQVMLGLLPGGNRPRLDPIPQAPPLRLERARIGPWTGPLEHR